MPTDYPRPAILPLDGGQAFKLVEGCEEFLQKHNLWHTMFLLSSIHLKESPKKKAHDFLPLQANRMLFWTVSDFGAMRCRFNPSHSVNPLRY